MQLSSIHENMSETRLSQVWSDFCSDYLNKACTRWCHQHSTVMMGCHFFRGDKLPMLLQATLIDASGSPIHEDKTILTSHEIERNLLEGRTGSVWVGRWWETVKGKISKYIKYNVTVSKNDKHFKIMNKRFT